MPRLVDRLRGYPPFEQLLAEVVKLLERTGVAEAQSGAPAARRAGAHSQAWVDVSVPVFAHAFVAAGLLESAHCSDRPALVVAPNQEAAEELEHELALYCPDRPVAYLPPRGVWYGSEGEVKSRIAGRRARAIAAIRGSVVTKAGRPVIVVEATTLMEGVVSPVVPPLVLEVGVRQDFEAAVRHLVDLGYVRVDQVEDAGDFSVRGGLIDVFPATEVSPVRVEFWGDDIESLRSFSVYSQRSLGPLERVRLYAAAEGAGEEPVPLTELLPAATCLIRTDPARATARVEAFQSDLADVLGDSTGEGAYLSWTDVEEQLRRLPAVTLSSLVGGG